MLLQWIILLLTLSFSFMKSIAGAKIALDSMPTSTASSWMCLVGGLYLMLYSGLTFLAGFGLALFVRPPGADTFLGFYWEFYSDFCQRHRNKLVGFTAVCSGLVCWLLVTKLGA